MTRTLKERYPFEVSPLVYCPEGDVRAISVSIKSFSSNFPSLLKVFAEEGLHIIYMRSPSLCLNEESCSVVFILDFSTSKVDGERLVDKLKSLEFVEDAVLAENFLPSLVSDILHFPPLFAGRRSLILDYSLLHSIKVRLSESFGKRIVETLLWSIGVTSGKNFYDFYRVLYNPLSYEDWIKVFKLVFMSLGWFTVEEWSVNPDRGGTIIISGSWESMLSSERTKSCYMIKGVISGFLSRLLNKNVEVVEEECAAEGKEYCKFSIKV